MNRVRFAPSPTGYVHVGNARTAIFNYLYSKRTGNPYILRIEDTDLERSKREYENNLIKDLEWLGIEWDESPVKGGDYGPYRQSDRFNLYEKYYKKLLRENKAYYCFCTEEELAIEKEKQKREGENIVYSGKCRRLDPEESEKRVADGESAVIRFRSTEGVDISFKDIVRGDVSFRSELIGDMIIVRSNGDPAYNFTVVIDDHEMEIGLVIRGEDHLTNTFKQIEIFNALGFNHPQYAHLSMVMGSDNTKLSKRHGSVSVSDFRSKGYLPEALFNYLSLLGWSPGDNRELLTKDDLISSFDLSRVTKSAAIFDIAKLNWFNREHLRILEPVELGRRISPYLKDLGITFEKNIETLKWIGSAGKVLANYAYTLKDISSLFMDFFNFDPDSNLKDKTLSADSAKKVILLFSENLNEMKSPVPFSSVSVITKKIRTDLGVNGKELYHPIRLSLTGKDKGIELKDFIPLIENGSVLNFSPKILNMSERVKKFLK